MYIENYTRLFLISFLTIALCILSYHLLELFSYLPTLSILSSGLILFNIFDVFRNFKLIVKFRLFLERGCLINVGQLLFNVVSNTQKGLRYLLHLRFRSRSMAKHITFYIVSLKISVLLIAMSLYFHLLTVFKITTCVVIVLQCLSDLQLLDDCKSRLNRFYAYLDELFTSSLENPDLVRSEENRVLELQYHEQNFSTIDTDVVFQENDESELNYLEKFYPNNSLESFRPLEDTDSSDGNSIFDGIEDDESVTEQSDLNTTVRPQSRLDQELEGPREGMKKTTDVLRREFFSLLLEQKPSLTSSSGSVRRSDRLAKSKTVAKKSMMVSSDDEDEDFDNDFVFVRR